MNLEALEQAVVSSDRNMRAKAAKAIKGVAVHQAVGFLIVLLRDSKRRVRDSAVRSAVGFLQYPEVLDELKKICANPEEKPKIRRAALEVLLGSRSGLRGVGGIFEEPGFSAVLANERYRALMLPALLCAEATPAVDALLKEFVKHGTREEAISATKALCGFKVINIGDVRDLRERQVLIAEGERAFGEVFYWTKRT